MYIYFIILKNRQKKTIAFSPSGPFYWSNCAATRSPSAHLRPIRSPSTVHCPAPSPAVVAPPLAGPHASPISLAGSDPVLVFCHCFSVVTGHGRRSDALRHRQRLSAVYSLRG